MALTSPGVEVTIIDQSQYLPAPTNSVPLVILATAQNKANASGTAVAPATTAANANKLYQVTSQRDLIDLYGVPFFYTTTNGTPIQGYELNEYGLLAAYSLLGVTNRCYVLRANIDLASLVGQTARPVGSPTNGTWWLNTSSSTWGIYEFNASTGKFEIQSPIVITDSNQLAGEVPVQGLGSIGNYAVNAIAPSGTTLQAAQDPTYFYKNGMNEWVALGSYAWAAGIPTIITNSFTTLSASGSFTFTTSGTSTSTVTLASGDTPVSVAGKINALGLTGITANGDTGKVLIYSSQYYQNPNQCYIDITTVTGTASTILGLTTGNSYQPIVSYGTSSEMPLWTTGQTTPRPTGSVWIKVGSSGNGLNPVVSEYSTATSTWITKYVTLAETDWEASATLDPTGGALIPAGTIYGQYNFNGSLYSSGSADVPGETEPPFYLYERLASGPTIVTGTQTSVTTSGTKYLDIRVSQPGSATLEVYLLTVGSLASAQDFVDAWLALAIPYTNAAVTTTGAIQLTQTVGGTILMTDTINSSGLYTGTSNGLLAAIGFAPGSALGIDYGPAFTGTFNAVATTSSPGSGATVNLYSSYGNFLLSTVGVHPSIAAVGSGYSVGNILTIPIGTIGNTSAIELEVLSVSGGGVTSIQIVSDPGIASINYSAQLTNWVPLTYTANEGAPSISPSNNTNWFYSVVDQVDIMVNYNGQWNGYANLNYDENGFPLPSGSNMTDPNGPIVSASAPTTQSDGTTALAYGDIWIDTSDLELYPVISRWQLVDNNPQWVLIDNADGTSSKGIVFADVRWSSSGAINPVDDPIPTIQSLLPSDYIDLDAPSPALYPQGMLVFNTRRSGYNVKQFRTNYFTSANFPNAGAYNSGDPTNVDNLPEFSYTWVTVSGNQSNGAPYMGRQAQRVMVVKALRAAIDTNTDIRDEDNYFNLLATPNYPELQPNMVVLNADRGETGYIIGDTPLGLEDSATAIQAWATNAAGATSTGEYGLVTRNTYLGLFYPSGLTTDLSGNQVVVPASHMMLRTFLRNDTIAYPWLAAAGTRRGTIDNALSIGWLDRATGEFQPIKTRIGIRDVLYINQINPLVFFTGIGLLNYGNKNSFNSASALDRTNVARLINYIRRQLTIAARPFVFEPNDALTRGQIAGVIQTLFVDLVAKRGIYDYLVVCDESNNTPARIDRNELWVDVAIEPVKAAEFIYIPVRVLNTGEIAALANG